MIGKQSQELTDVLDKNRQLQSVKTLINYSIMKQRLNDNPAK